MILFTLDSSLCWQITLTLLHVSWIGMLVGLIAAVGSRALSHSSASRRYWLHLTSLVVLASSVPITFATVRGLTLDDSQSAAFTRPMISMPDASETDLSVDAFDDASHGDSSFAKDSANAPNRKSSADAFATSGGRPVVRGTVNQALRDLTKRVAPYVTFAYTLGVLLMLIKLAISVRFTHHLQSAGRPIQDPGLLIRLAEHAQKLSLKVLPVIATCEQVTVPIVVGLLRPMILIPTAMISGLTLEQLDAVLTHELGHLRRRDHMVIVVQRLLEAMLFFHPVTWYLSRQIHHERECSCDDLVVSIGRDRLQYAQSLLRVAELQKATSPQRKYMALAADGQSPSKLRLRIARILRNSDDCSVHVSGIWVVAGLLTILATCFGTVFLPWKSAAASSQEVIMPNPTSVLTLIEKAYGGGDSVKTSHVIFRMARLSGNLRTGLTPEVCKQLIVQADLVHNAENLRGLLGSLVERKDLLVDTPWTSVEMYRDVRKIRIITKSGDRTLDDWVSDPPSSLTWDSANSQMQLLRLTDDREQHETLKDLFDPAITLGFIKSRLPDCEIRKVSGSIILVHRPSDSLRITVDSTTGCVLSSGRYTKDFLEQETLQFGWKEQSEGFWLPSVTIRLAYAIDGLAECEALLIEHASINTPLPEGIFQLGAPVGSVIVDRREGLQQVYTINRDVFDVTSEEQLNAAQAPLDEELTDTEKVGVADARRIYGLREDSALKRVGPPFPLSRKYVSRMLGERSVHRPPELSRLIRWNGTRFDEETFKSGRSFSTCDLVMRLGELAPSELEGDTSLMELRIPGDFVFREGASKDDLLQALQTIVSDEARVPVSMEFRDVERTVYKASGKFLMNLPKGKSLFEINGGDHTGDVVINHGNVNAMLQSLAAYINLRIINNVEQHDETFRWSERSSRRESTSTEDRFQVDPAFTLKQITEQTGIRFTEEKQLVRTLFVESKSPAEKTAR